MARFLGGLNREIQDILAYKEYNNVTCLFHLACKAEREVQGRRASARSNISAGKTNSWQQRMASTPSTCISTPSSSDKTRAAPTNSVAKTMQSLLRVLHPWHRWVEQATYNVTGARDMGT